jgi:radical SAM superfamily enzyme YgiQ (UPF0313 family)
MRILVVNPPFETGFIREGRCQSPQNMRQNSIPQMTIAYMAGILERDNHELQVYDCIASGLDPARLFEKMGAFAPELTLINTTTPTIDSDLRFVSLMKDRFPKTIVAVFGSHVTVLHDRLLSDQPQLDIVIRNEPEFTAREIPSAVADGVIVREIPGCTIRLEGEIQVCPHREFENHLDRLGLPAWHHLPLDRYTHPVFNERYLAVNTSRGCKHKCIFCVAPTYYGNNLRFRSPEAIVREIEHDVASYGVRHYWFYADDFTAKPEFVKDLCRAIIDARLDIRWWSNTRVDKRDEEMFRLMKKAGAVMLSIGGESGSLEVLKRMRKAARPEFTRETVRLLRRAGIDSVVYFLFGLPGETKNTIRETIEFAKSINPDFVEFYPATPYPGTEFHDIAEKEGLISRNEWSDYHYGEIVVERPGLDAAELRRQIKRGYWEFYLRPRYAWVLLRRLRRPRDFGRLVRFGLGYIAAVLR